jgi:uncharacterized membrane protein
LTRLFGIGAGRRAVTVRKSIYVSAPVEEVFNLWTDFESFPRFMQHVHEVHEGNSGAYRWTVAGPAGSQVSFNTELTRFVEGEEIAWKTLPGAAVQHAGKVRFQPEWAGTRLDVQMSYNPVFGFIGHAVAAAFGVDPKTALDHDLVRLKSLLEEGKTTAHGKEARLEEMEPGIE